AVVASTAHTRMTRVPDTRRDRPLLIPGTEVDVGRTRLGEPYHILGIGLRQMIELPRDVAKRHGLDVQEVIEALRKAAATVFVAHPYWSGLVGEELLPLHGVAGIEVFNDYTEDVYGKGYSGVH